MVSLRSQTFYTCSLIEGLACAAARLESSECCRNRLVFPMLEGAHISPLPSLFPVCMSAPFLISFKRFIQNSGSVLAGCGACGGMFTCADCGLGALAACPLSIVMVYSLRTREIVIHAKPLLQLVVKFPTLIIRVIYDRSSEASGTSGGISSKILALRILARLCIIVRMVLNGVSEGRCCHQTGGRATRNSWISNSTGPYSSSCERSAIIFTLRHIHFISNSINFGKLPLLQVSRSKMIKAL